ncbi:DUF4097 family beta strand repeat-containing protein [Paenibacillus sp. FSL H8-0048]|uniref:DUF4097 family beta strand repeat-containing protein n=1 Tax=Paenibacillus sp. FSL H8-0048 TaxID=2954508 RepID=UPI0030F5650A
MKVTWKRLLTGVALAAVFLYIGKGIGGAAEARQLSEEGFVSAPAGATVSAAPDRVTESVSGASVSLPESISGATSTAAEVIESWQAEGAGSFSGDAGYSFDKGTTYIPLPAGTDSVSIKNTNGNIEIKQGNVKELEIQMTVVVHQATAEVAKEIANKSGMKAGTGANLEIETYSEFYGNHQSPSLELTVTLPQGMKAELQARTENGNLSLSKVSSTGKIKLSSVNGNITATGIPEELVLHTVNGDVQVSEAKSSVEVKLTNGNVQASQISGDLAVKAVNGNLTVKDALAAVRASTVAGNIEVESRKIGGNWTVTTAVGDLELAWPGGAGVEVDAESGFDEIETDFPLTVKNHKAHGRIGAGTYQIHAKAMAGLSLMQN